MREKRKKPQVRGLVGVDEGERVEQGRARKGRGKRVKRRRSTHGRRAGREERERAVPRKSGLEVNYGVVNREGKRRETKGGMGQGRSLRRGEAGAGSLGGEEWETRREGGWRVGWETRTVPNRYDYYLEGHRVNRVSKVRSKSSREGEGENRKV
jgi:hypothetical protein